MNSLAHRCCACSGLAEILYWSAVPGCPPGYRPIYIYGLQFSTGGDVDLERQLLAHRALADFPEARSAFRQISIGAMAGGRRGTAQEIGAAQGLAAFAGHAM